MKKSLLLLLLGLLLFYPACQASSTAVTLSVSGLDSFAFTPDPLTLPAGAEVTINFSNEGALQHNWVLIPPDVQPLLATTADALNGASSGDINGGSAVSFTFDAPEQPGDYFAVCTVPGHAAGGMIGRVTVTPP